MKNVLEKPIQDIYNTIYKNAVRFLERAISETTRHQKDSLEEDQALIACLFMQLAIELAIKAYIIQTHGIGIILKQSDRSKTPDELHTLFFGGELNTVQFYLLRNYLVENDLIFNEEQLEHIKLFQEHRNKLVHLHLELAKGDLYDLKYQLIYVIVHIIIPLLTEINPSYETPSEFYEAELENKNYLKLVKFPPYVKEMEDLATDFSSRVYRCPKCREKTFAVDNEICYCCNLNYIGAAGFVDCPGCEASHSLAYDHLNIGLNDNIVRGLCLNCDETPDVYQCPNCETATGFYDLVDLKDTCYEKCQLSDD